MVTPGRRRPAEGTQPACSPNGTGRSKRGADGADTMPRRCQQAAPNAGNKQNDNDMDKRQLMMRAIKLSEESVENGGGPFGAVIARNGEIVAEASNSVTPDCDPTAHAEVNAIRKAARATGSYDLSGCEIYTSCEPCPMCLGAIYWAHLDKVYYANDRKDAARIGFDDDFIYKELELKPADRHKPSEILMAGEAKRAFEMWQEKGDKMEY